MQSRQATVSIVDAGGGAGTWQVEVHAQSASSGASIGAPAVTVPPNGQAQLAVSVSAAADAQAGDNFGYLVLRRGTDTRRIPYLFLVTRPALESVQPTRLVRLQAGTTARGASRVDRYRFPDSPYGPSTTYTGPPMQEDGGETLYVTTLDRQAVNLGVAADLMGANALIDPFFLGSPDENNVQGYAGTPANVNGLTFGYRLPVGAAGVVFPQQQDFFVSVDSGRDPFNGRRLAGTYRLRSWVNDVTAPAVALVTTTVAAGRPTLVVRATDAGAGIDPLELAIGYQRVAVGAAAYDPESGIAVFPLPAQAPALQRTQILTLAASDYQESKNVNTQGDNVMPNTTFRNVRLRVVSRPTVTWLRPENRQCGAARQQLLVVASSTARIASVRFVDGRRTVATVRRGVAGLYSATWRTRRLERGVHRLTAIVRDARGRTASSTRVARVCR